ncbi:fungal-specific transcription factor domain-containing protein [Lipomyces tetrasporus]|uniref:Fungal-specific transcription factor domain-containing protein n=1 Tax=Lipomyces tetrasporus TaxID=54092 RepID=A0AAD7QUN2_9ASCO|nr:fungal-specific transcription factor domain-containing protein [Lipomyces tetrasporus]KAJ8101598.1 fungal-specific transcription factor domain-containing protein [Lipomyces tetrasporus]
MSDSFNIMAIATTSQAPESIQTVKQIVDSSETITLSCDVQFGQDFSNTRLHVLSEDENSANPVKKKKKTKSRKGLERIFVCEVAGCNKSFTRLEHLGRHQLNHSPKEIYTCSWPGCTKSFVREDLRLRHVERHRKRSSVNDDSQPPDESSAPSQPDRSTSQQEDFQPSVRPSQLQFASTTIPHHRKLETVDGQPFVANDSAMAFATVDYTKDSTTSLVPNLPNFQSFVADSHISNTSTNAEYNRELQSFPSSSMAGVSQVRPDVRRMSHHSISDPALADNGNYLDHIMRKSTDTTQERLLGENVATQVSPSSADLIDWLFSDGMLSGNRDFFASQDVNSFLESPLIDVSQLSTPPQLVHSRVLSEAKRQQLLTMLPSLESNPDFTLDKIHQYIDLYWEKFHFQFPILHKRSLEIDTSPEPVVFSMILIGASYNGARELAIEIAEPLRWIIFSSPGFHPPTKVWILQSLLLLEVFEKTMSSRKHHERAHIHHGATLQLIRRGRTLLDPSIALSGEDDADASSWKRWVEAESIKRAVFMAFILDVSHAIVFGHNLLMYPYEMRLSLPCDDRVWDSADDERRVLMSKPTVSFLVGLKRLLNQQSVEADGFGRHVLLCGLLSLSIQMSQQALQVSSIGWGSFRDTWKSTLGRAYDFWKEDYERAGSVSRDKETGVIPVRDSNRPIFWLLYRMAHVCMQVPRYDLRVFCGDERVLGRSTLMQDYLAARRHMYEWSRTKGAREAAFHSIKALFGVFVLGDGNTSSYPAGYSIADDVFIHRSTMIVDCMLVFWTYAYCVEGPESDILSNKSNLARASFAHWKDHEWAIAAESGRTFLERMNSANTPDELERTKNKHLTVGLLKWVILSLRGSKRELVGEMCNLLDNCVQMSLGREDEIEDRRELARAVQVG